MESGPASLLLVGAGLCGLGGTILIASVLGRWGPPGLVAGVVFLLAGFAGLFASTARRTQTASVTCPSCGEPGLAPADLDRSASAACHRCGTYCHRTDSGVVVAFPDAHVAPAPIFEARLPSGDLRWGPGCAVCSSIPCEPELIASPREVMVRVPVCHLHRGAEAAAVRIARSGRAVIRFRSHAAARRFRAFNPG
ncbi:MAG: hypothetical protein KC731_02765 [Myxococcales bacterium]|nr:hypothetical protein [Myxococcales bacterium]